MPYSSQNQSGLLGLVAALKAGMDPSTAYSLYQGIEQNQASRVAARQERLGGLADLLMGNAQGGMSYEGANALAEAAPGPAGPAVQNMLSSLYPREELAPASGYEAFRMGGERGFDQFANNQPLYGPRPEQSPAYTGSPAGQMQELQLQQAQTELAGEDPAIEAAWAGLMADLAAFKSKGVPPDVAFSTITQQNPELAAFFTTDEGRLKGIMQAIYGQAAVQYAGGAGLQG